MSLASLLKKGSLRGFATATPATPATHPPFNARTVATVATVAVAKAPDRAANDPASAEPDDLENLQKPVIAIAAPDPDRWAWPHSEAMNGSEIDTFTARLHHFTRRGLAVLNSEKLADKLVIRDREADERRLCLECSNLGRGSGWRCNQWQRAGLGAAGIPAGLVLQLQRCDSFNDSTQPKTTL